MMRTFQSNKTVVPNEKFPEIIISIAEARNTKQKLPSYNLLIDSGNEYAEYAGNAYYSLTINKSERARKKQAN